ncbi:MAG: T9SS type A sorting domain-containing protein [Vicingaceae bacterium]|nr:T9SS type A sorting domain-containing protein [Vicingaceae bacterium]
MKNFKTLLIPFGLIALVVGIFSFTNHNDSENEKCKIKIVKIVNGVKTEVDSTFDCSDKMEWVSSFGGDEGDSLQKMIKMMMIEGGDSNEFSFEINIESDEENSMKFKGEDGEEVEMHFDMKMVDGEDGVMKMMINGKEMEIKLGDITKHLEHLGENIKIIDDESGKVEIRIDTDEDGGESETVEIIKAVDDDGNVTVKKTVNGKEVEFDEEDMKSMHAGHKVMMIKGGKGAHHKGEHEMVIDVNIEGDDGKEMKKIVIISKMTKTEKPSKNIPTAVDMDKKELIVDRLKFSPNPNDGKFDLNFKLKDQKPVQVKIVDMQGKEVYSEMVKDFDGKYANKIDISENGEGIYILQIVQGKKASTSKIVIK